MIDEHKGFCCFDPQANRFRLLTCSFLNIVPSTLFLLVLSPDRPSSYPLDPFPGLFPVTGSDPSFAPQVLVYHRRACEPLTAPCE